MIGFAELEPFLDRKRHELLAAVDWFDPVSEAKSLREAEGGWTPCDVLEHVAMVERMVTAQVQLLLDSAPALPSEPAGDKLVDITEPFRERGLLGSKKKTPPHLEPSGLMSYEEAMREMQESRAQLKALLPHLALRETNALIAPHPLGLSLNACQWVLFSAFHEWSHIHQLKRIRAAHPRA
ncbi:DinB family protein [Paenibacillus chartarius]|uniref:DinB family protein n=1 Tax=Paenibacillus chartarius TaxID=747481 RepID=A0ABV6DVJ6_9BACL